MKKYKKVFVIAIILICLLTVFLICEIPSNFGRKPFYGLSASMVERGEVVQGTGYFDLWRAALDEQEIVRVCEILSHICLRDKADLTNHFMKDGEGGSGYEYFCLYLKSGSIIRVAMDEFFYRNFRPYTVDTESKRFCIELKLFHDQLIEEKGFYKLLGLQTD